MSTGENIKEEPERGGTTTRKLEKRKKLYVIVNRGNPLSFHKILMVDDMTVIVTRENRLYAPWKINGKFGRFSSEKDAEDFLFKKGCEVWKKR